MVLLEEERVQRLELTRISPIVPTRGSWTWTPHGTAAAQPSGTLALPRRVPTPPMCCGKNPGSSGNVWGTLTTCRGAPGAALTRPVPHGLSGGGSDAEQQDSSRVVLQCKSRHFARATYRELKGMKTSLRFAFLLN